MLAFLLNIVPWNDFQVRLENILEFTFFVSIPHSFDLLELPTLYASA